MVSVLDSGSSGPGSRPGGGIALCSWARHLTLTVPLSTQVYKWVLANLMLGVTLQWTSIPSRGGVEIFLVDLSYGNRDKLRPGEPLWLICRLYLYVHQHIDKWREWEYREGTIGLNVNVVVTITECQWLSCHLSALTFLVPSTVLSSWP